MLGYIGEIISEVGTVGRIKRGVDLFRVRTHKASIDYHSASDLGTPKPEDADDSNRFSPAGIPMFYGSFDEQTALAEKLGIKNPEKDTATIARFVANKEFLVLDLTNLPKTPSLFDEDKRMFRQSILFLKSFVAESSMPIEKDGREHIEYAPTQVFTEYLRDVYDWGGKRLDGIVYPSAIIEGKVSCVLFTQAENCCDDLQGRLFNESAHESNCWLLLRETRRQAIT
jgi:hypothetical protein